MASTQSLKETMEPVAWMFQLITALFMVFFLGVHLILMHAYGLNNILIQAILNRLHNPWWKAFYIAFVISITYHGLNGLRGVILDLGVKKVKALNAAFWVVAIITIIYGVWLLFNI
ncbi:MAG: succinate dehydrogenase hydrophobic membrane anchor subunit [Thermoplasmata archaeon]|nr:succinate dehydrogenase [Thermoplasmata archaeon]